MRLHRYCIVVLLACSLCACGKNNKKDAEMDFGGPTFDRDEDGNLVRRFDVNGDNRPDVSKTFVEYPDEQDPSITRRRMIKKEVDVNSDGEINLRRMYNEAGQLVLEEVDTDLDGRIDVVNHVDGGALIQKDLVDPESGVIVASRYYLDGTIQRVEKDTNDDEKVDYWEFYEQGVLDRIGRDLNADGRADTWQRR